MSGTGRLAGRVALVTGSGQNIGRAIARLFAAEGAAVVVNGARSRDKVDAVVAEIAEAGGRAMGIMADVGDPDQVGRMVAQAAAHFGTLDIVVNNAAVRRAEPLAEMTPDSWNRTITTNLSSCFYTVHAALPFMMARRWGRIINISGTDGFSGAITQRPANITAKAGMHALAKALSFELGEFGITANTVAVGGINTERDWSQYAHVDFADAIRRIPARRFGEVEDVAEACLYLAGESGRHVLGQAIHVNGGSLMV